MITIELINEVNNKTNLIRDEVVKQLKKVIPRTNPSLNNEEFWEDIEDANFMLYSIFDSNKDTYNDHDWFCLLTPIFHDTIMVKYGILNDEWIKINNAINLIEVL